ncbi:MAG: family 20 glycosylhydrolase [Clostridiales bacterium]|nr:family 20 glycosylhydrolase [Clostridiales bacterium]
MRRHGLKKGLSLLLVLCMILSLLPMTALAEEISEPSAAVEEQSPASGDTTAVDTGEDQQDEADTGETSEAGTGETGEAGTGEAGEAGTGETGEAGTGEESKSTIDKITDILGDFLGTISGEKSEEEAAQDEANAKAAELALSKAAAEEAAAQQAAEEAAAKAAAEQLEAELEAVLTVEATKEARDTSGDDFYKVVHLDAGRKYFSVENIKAIIDTMADAGYNQLELYLPDNQGFRFALDNMTITTSYGTYDLSLSLGDGYSDGSKYPDGSGNYLTQDDMDTIIAYAKKNHIEIVPCINTPGHMGAILEEFSDFCYSDSKSSIDLENPEAVAFALAIVKKYADYFAGKGCDFFNIGADEYANDLSSTMGFAGLYSSGKYQRFVDYLNAAAQIVINEGMPPPRLQRRYLL